MAYDELLAAGYTDRVAARYLRVPEAIDGMRLARHRHTIGVMSALNYPGEALRKWYGGVP